MSKNSLEYLYLNHLKPMMENNLQLQENLCEDCLPESPSPYSLDTAICSKCGEKKECTNTFLYNIVKICKFSPENDWYGKVPRVYRKDRA